MAIGAFAVGEVSTQPLDDDTPPHRGGLDKGPRVTASIRRRVTCLTTIFLGIQVVVFRVLGPGGLLWIPKKVGVKNIADNLRGVQAV